MAGEKINLCAPIPAGLHRQVRERQTQSGKSLGEYMTWLITTFYQSEEEQKMMNTDTRTVAFQVPAELFEAFKDYLQRRGMRQKKFFLACIQDALADEAEEHAEETEQGTATDQEEPQGENG